MNGNRFKTEDPAALGYKELEHAGFSWLAMEQGRHFILEVEDWSEHALALREGWITTERRYHLRYLARDRNQKAYFIKAYFPKPNKKRLFAHISNRARKEFWNTVAVHKVPIQTVLPLALGERKNDQRWGIVIYPFVDNSASFSTLYETRPVSTCDVRERQSLERAVGSMTRKIIDEGLYPIDLVLNHFLVERVEEGKCLIYWVDLERVKSSLLFRKSNGVKTLARLLARMEWLRKSGYQVNRASMLRIAHAFFHKEACEKLDKKACNQVIRAARKLWLRKGWDKKRPEEFSTSDL